MSHPNWVLSFRQKGQEIKKIQDKYYLYEVSSYYDKVKKCTVKKSGKYLGRITEGGLITKDNKSSFAIPRKVSVKEYGASDYILSCLDQEVALLETHLPTFCWEIIICAIFRLLYQSAFKQMLFHYESSYLSEIHPNLKLGGKQISSWLRILGENREALVSVMRGLQEGSDLILIDSTHITTQSKQNLSAQLGYNSQRDFDTQVNLLYLFSQDQQMPIFYRCVQGSIREVRSLQLTLQETGLSKAILVSDKGFYSANNVNILEENHWRYVLPLRRSSNLIDYSEVETGDKAKLDGYFMFEKRVIWFKDIVINEDKKVVLFLDETLKLAESEDYLRRISEGKENYTLEKFYQKQSRFGTIAVLTNITTAEEKENEEGKKEVVEGLIHAQKVYEYLKSRNDIEQLNDTYKNVLEADKTYMQSEVGMEAWHFINFLAIRVYYKIFALLKNKGLNKKNSVMDVLLLLQNQKKIKINEQWVDSEIPKKAKDILELLFEAKNSEKDKTVT